MKPNILKPLFLIIAIAAVVAIILSVIYVAFWPEPPVYKALYKLVDANGDIMATDWVDSDGKNFISVDYAENEEYTLTIQEYYDDVFTGEEKTFAVNAAERGSKQYDLVIAGQDRSYSVAVTVNKLMKYPYVKINPNGASKVSSYGDYWCYYKESEGLSFPSLELYYGEELIPLKDTPVYESFIKEKRLLGVELLENRNVKETYSFVYNVTEDDYMEPGVYAEVKIEIVIVYEYDQGGEL